MSHWNARRWTLNVANNIPQHVDNDSDMNTDSSYISIILQPSSEQPPDVGEQLASEDSYTVTAVSDIQSSNSNDKEELPADCVTDVTSAMPQQHSDDMSCSQDSVSQ